MKRPVIYIAGPMTADDGWQWEQNCRIGEEVAFEVIKAGGAPICPHSMGRNFRGTLSFDTWMDVDLALLDRCDGIVLLPGWKSSKGARQESHHAFFSEISRWMWGDSDHTAKRFKRWLESLTESASNGR